MDSLISTRRQALLRFFLLSCPVLLPPPTFSQIRRSAGLRSDRGTVIARTPEGEFRWTADWTMSPSNENGEEAVRFTESGRGRYFPFKEAVTWTLEAVWLAGPAFYPLRFSKTTTGSSGTRLAIETKEFDRNRRTARFSRKLEKGDAESRSFAAGPDVLAIEGIAGILSYLPFEQASTVKAHLLSNEPKLYDVSLEPRGKETISAASGRVECYKIEVVPHLGLLNLFRPILPKTYFWFAVAQPHRWVRFQGLEAGPGSPEIVME